MYCFHPRCLKPFAFQFLVLAMSLTSTMTLAQPLTVDASGRESAYSNEAPAVIPSPYRLGRPDFSRNAAQGHYGKGLQTCDYLACPSET